MGNFEAFESDLTKLVTSQARVNRAERKGDRSRDSLRPSVGVRSYIFRKRCFEGSSKAPSTLMASRVDCHLVRVALVHVDIIYYYYCYYY